MAKSIQEKPKSMRFRITRPQRLSTGILADELIGENKKQKKIRSLWDLY